MPGAKYWTPGRKPAENDAVARLEGAGDTGRDVVKKILAAIAIGGYAVTGLFGSTAGACDDGPNSANQSLPSPAGGTIWYSTGGGDAGATVTGSQGYIEARQSGDGVEVGGRHSTDAVYGQVNTSTGQVCVNDLP